MTENTLIDGAKSPVDVAAMQARVNGIRERIRAAAGEWADEVTLLAAVKYATPEQIDALCTECGVHDVGENRVQQLLEHYEMIRCKEQLDGWKYGLAPADKDVPPERWDSRFVTALIWSDYIDYLIDIIDFGENDDRFELFIRKKEVEEIAERLIADHGPIGCCRTCVVS